MNLAKSRQSPAYFIKYEDLAVNTKPTLKEAFSYIMGVENIEGTYIEKRIEDVLNGSNAGFIYKPRSGKINLNTNEKYFSEAQKKYVLRACRELLNYFGYTKIEGVENKFAFFEFDNLSEEEVANAGKFHDLNRECLQWLIKEREAVDDIEVVQGKPDTGITIKFQDEPLVKFQKIRHSVKMEYK